MEVIYDKIFIDKYHLIKESDKIENFKFLSIIDDSHYYDLSLLYQFEMNNIIKYGTITIKNQSWKNIIFEVINEIPLWSINYKIENKNSYCCCYYSIYLNSDYISNYINYSSSLKMLINMRFKELPIINSNPEYFNNFNKKSFISVCQPHNISKSFKLELYDYQKRTLNKMLQIEKIVRVILNIQ
jgi:hypothetical protein